MIVVAKDHLGQEGFKFVNVVVEFVSQERYIERYDIRKVGKEETCQWSCLKSPNTNREYCLLHLRSFSVYYLDYFIWTTSL